MRNKQFIFNSSFIVFIVTFFIQKLIFLNYLSLFLIALYTVEEIYSNYSKINFNFFKDKNIVLITLLVLIELVTSAISYDTQDALNQWRKDYLLIFIFGFILLINLSKIKAFEIYTNMILSLVLVDIYYIYEIFKLNDIHDIFSPLFIAPRDATFIIPILLPFSLYGCILYKDKKNLLIISTISILLSILITLYSGSRGAMVTFLLEITIFFIYLLFSLLKNYFSRYLILLSLVIFIAIPSFGMKNIAFKNMIERGFSPNGRDVILLGWLPVIKDHIWTGIGLGNSNAEHYLKTYAISNEYVVVNQQKQLQMGTHNRFVSILLESGIFALMVYIISLIYLLKNLFHFKKSIFSFYNIYSLTFITIIVEHFLFRGTVEALKLSSFYLIVFLISFFNRQLNDA